MLRTKFLSACEAQLKGTRLLKKEFNWNMVKGTCLTKGHTL